MTPCAPTPPLRTCRGQDGPARARGDEWHRVHGWEWQGNERVRPGAIGSKAGSRQCAVVPATYTAHSRPPPPHTHTSRGRLGDGESGVGGIFTPVVVCRHCLAPSRHSLLIVDTVELISRQEVTKKVQSQSLPVHIGNHRGWGGGLGGDLWHTVMPRWSARYGTPEAAQRKRWAMPQSLHASVVPCQHRGGGG